MILTYVIIIVSKIKFLIKLKPDNHDIDIAL